MSNTVAKTNILDFAVLTVRHGEKFVTLLGLVTNDDPRLSDARVPLPHTHPLGDIIGLEVFQLRSEKDQPNGYPSLDATGKVPGTEIRYGVDAATACEGNDPRLSDARTPTGPASGDLSGTYPAPTVTGLQGNQLPAAVPGGFLKRTRINNGWEETADVPEASRLDDLEQRFQTLVAQLADQVGLTPASRLQDDLEQGLSLID